MILHSCGIHKKIVSDGPSEQPGALPRAATQILAARPLPANDRLRAGIERMRTHRAELEAERGDLEAYVDRFAEEMLGTPEAALVLIEYVLRANGEHDPKDG